MSRYQIKSVFEQISEKVFHTTSTLSETKTLVIDFVNTTHINDKDKKMIIYNINKAQSLIRLQTYVCNSLLQYEGLGMNQLDHNKEDFKNSDAL